MSLDSPSFKGGSRFSFGDSPKVPRRADSGSTRTKVELHQVDVLLQKEIGRLERQQNAAVSNIANHQQAMKMSWRKLEQRRASDSPLLNKNRERTSSSPCPRRGLFHSNTKLQAGQNVWKVDSASSLDDAHSLASSQTVKVAGDVYHRRSIKEGPPSSLLNKKVSPYLSSPYNMRRPRTQESLSSLSASTNSQSAVKSDATSDKGTLLKASKLMGLEHSSHSLHNFKEFYSDGVEKSASAVLVSSVLDESMRATEQINEDATTDDEPSALLSSGGELTMAEMFDQIKNCRYIRRYHPGGPEQ